ncbi:MAG: Elongation factor 1-beta [Candidatus Methanolliviera sp. GoM_asphalt]|nr:MAG: Elongation factor 1-beta [Candidatus Methanolliviera sp. GoM_asphalt]
MGEVAAKIKIMPEGTETDLDKLKETIKTVLPKNAVLKTFEEVPVAFGLVSLFALVLVGDEEGGTEAVEDAIEAIDDVESVQVVSLGRI